MTTPKVEKKKRGSYRQKECPYCHKHFGNVQNHIKLVHQAEAEAGGRQLTPPAEKQVSKEELLSGKKPPVETKPEDRIYYCTNCRAELRKGENPCWHCGEQLVWEGVN